jgi:hypothetical protein
MAYVGVFTDSNNQISFDVQQVPCEVPDKYLEFAKFVINPYEKTEILRALSPLCLSDYYMIFTLMDGEMWTPTRQDPMNDIQEYITNLIINIDTIEEEPEISDPD